MTEIIEVHTLWDKCLNYLRDEIPAQKFNTWLRPLHAEINNNTLTLLAPNQFVLDWVNDNFLIKITGTLRELCEGEPPLVKLCIGTKSQGNDNSSSPISVRHDAPMKHFSQDKPSVSSAQKAYVPHQSNLNPTFRFDNFILGQRAECKMWPIK